MKIQIGIFVFFNFGENILKLQIKNNLKIDYQFQDEGQFKEFSSCFGGYLF
jgi:hypothetical protein